MAGKHFTLRFAALRADVTTEEIAAVYLYDQGRAFFPGVRSSLAPARAVILDE